MSDTTSHLLILAEKREEQIASVLEKIYAAARSDAVYSEPVTSGNCTVITASEIAAGGGFGSGFGFGSPTTPLKPYGGHLSPRHRQLTAPQAALAVAAAPVGGQSPSSSSGQMASRSSRWWMSRRLPWPLSRYAGQWVCC